MGVSLLAGRRSGSSWSTGSATRKLRWPGWKRKERCPPTRRFATIRCGHASESFLSCTSRLGHSKLWGSAPLRTASKNRAQCRRSRDLILTVSWRFGTLHPPIEYHLTGQGGVNDQVRACPANCLPESSPLPTRRRKYRQRHSWRDHERHGQRRPRRIAWLRRLCGEAPAGANRPESPDRSSCGCRQEIGAVLQDRQGNACAVEQARLDLGPVFPVCENAMIVAGHVPAVVF